MAFNSVSLNVPANGSRTVTAAGTGLANTYRWLIIYVQNNSGAGGDVFLGSSLASGVKFAAQAASPVAVWIAPGESLTFWAGATAATDVRLASSYQ